MLVPSKTHCERLFVHTGQESQGRYCVRFFKEGTFVNVVVDDQFPFNRAGQALFCTASDRNEIWPMLVEKAYAKVSERRERALRKEDENTRDESRRNGKEIM